jgi:hypothetical protein
MKMKQFRSILAVAVIVASITANLSPVLASPLQASCIKSGNSASTVRGIARDNPDSMISVGRNAIKVYGTVDVYYGSIYGETCSIQVHPSSEKVALAFAIPDNSNLGNVRVSIYVNGQERISKIMSRGQFRKYIFDVTDANSYAYTLEPIDDADGHVYFPYVSRPN